eukprot:COSAG05_NODE_26304_length_189_cov_36.922222_1_plen_48_part_01
MHDHHHASSAPRAPCFAAWSSAYVLIDEIAFKHGDVTVRASAEKVAMA